MKVRMPGTVTTEAPPSSWYWLVGHPTNEREHATMGQNVTAIANARGLNTQNAGRQEGIVWPHLTNNFMLLGRG